MCNITHRRGPRLFSLLVIVCFCDFDQSSPPGATFDISDPALHPCSKNAVCGCCDGVSAAVVAMRVCSEVSLLCRVKESF